MLTVTYAECHHAECRNVECRRLLLATKVCQHYYGFSRVFSL